MSGVSQIFVDQVMTKTPRALPTDPAKLAEMFLAEHPDVARIDTLLPDLTGVMRGKRIAPDQLEGLLVDGASFPASVFGTDATGDSVAASGLVWELGDADYPCRAIPETLMPVPWMKRPSAQVLLTMTEQDGTPFHSDPRVVLQRVAKRYADLGLTPVVAMELEFYLIDRVRGVDDPPQPAASPTSGARQATTQVYGLDELDDFEDLLDDVAEACRIQRIPAMTASAEYAPGQYEINLDHVADPVQAADHAILLKRAIKGVSRAHGFDATFMAKPFAEETGNGLHVHASILDRDGKNIFSHAEGKPEGSPKLKHAIGGLANTMGDVMALLGPTANSYKRLRPEAYVPLSACWGYNNRTTAFRIPSGSAKSTRIEHRVAGADGNPYLVLAAVLAGMLHGIQTEAEAPPPITGNAYQTETPSVPKTWAAALDTFHDSAFIADWFGTDFQHIFHAVKEQERRDFEREVTPLEWRWYLKTV
jgi:glutamine synthetase